jgi:RNA polymerase sigma factor (sigma-70 family)
MTSAMARDGHDPPDARDERRGGSSERRGGSSERRGGSARRGASSGRHDRFRRLYEEHGEAVLRYARRRTTPEAAEDVLAETFVVVWRRLDRVPAEPRGWLFAVARRVLANQRRGDSRREALVAKLALAPEPVTVEPAGGSALASALATLAERDHEILALVHWDGLTPREAATALGCTPLAARTRLHRARRRLASALEELEDDRREPAVLSATAQAP